MDRDQLRRSDQARSRSVRERRELRQDVEQRCAGLARRRRRVDISDDAAPLRHERKNVRAGRLFALNRSQTQRLDAHCLELAAAESLQPEQPRPAVGIIRLHAQQRCRPRKNDGDDAAVLDGSDDVVVHRHVRQGWAAREHVGQDDGGGSLFGCALMKQVSDDVARVASLLTKYTRIVALTGAGISTESGIPDSRGPQGVWTKNPLAEKLSNIHHYMSDPDVRKLAWQSRLDHPAWRAEPNAGHGALADLERR